MLEHPPTFEEIWRARVKAAVLAVVTFFLLIYLQWRVLAANFFLGAGLAPIWNFGAFQVLSKITTGRAFELRLNPKAKSPAEVFDLVLTVGFCLTLLIGLVVTYDAWTYVAPQL